MADYLVDSGVQKTVFGTAYPLGKAAPFGSLHFESGHWTIGDTVIDDLLTHILGSKGLRINALVKLEVLYIPSEVTAADVSLGGPFEDSEPPAKASK